MADPAQVNYQKKKRFSFVKNENLSNFSNNVHIRRIILPILQEVVKNFIFVLVISVHSLPHLAVTTLNTDDVACHLKQMSRKGQIFL